MHRPPLPPRNTPGTHFCQSLSQPLGHSAAGRIVSMKNSIDTIGNRTRDFPACSAVPQPSAPPRAPHVHICVYIYIYIYIYIWVDLLLEPSVHNVTVQYVWCCSCQLQILLQCAAHSTRNKYHYSTGTILLVVTTVTVPLLLLPVVLCGAPTYI